MAEFEEIALPHIEAHPLYIGLFKHVRNATFLRQQLLQGNTDFEYAFLDTSMILSREQVLAACFRAVNDMINDRLKSRNVHSEIVFSLSPNNNIAESFRRFGISDDTKHVLAIKVRTSPQVTKESVIDHVGHQVEGELVAFTDANISEMHDLARLKKIYKFDMPKDGNLHDANSFVLGSMALKGS